MSHWCPPISAALPGCLCQMTGHTLTPAGCTREASGKRIACPFTKVSVMYWIWVLKWLHVHECEKKEIYDKLNWAKEIVFSLTSFPLALFHRKSASLFRCEHSNSWSSLVSFHCHLTSCHSGLSVCMISSCSWTYKSSSIMVSYGSNDNHIQIRWWHNGSAFFVIYSLCFTTSLFSVSHYKHLLSFFSTYFRSTMTWSYKYTETFKNTNTSVHKLPNWG